MTLWSTGLELLLKLDLALQSMLVYQPQFTFSEKESKRKTEEGPTKRRASLPTSSHWFQPSPRSTWKMFCFPRLASSLPGCGYTTMQI